MDTNSQDSSAGAAAGIVALAADLMFAARVRSTAQAVGAQVQMARNGPDLIDLTRRLGPRLIIIDLDARMSDPVQLIRQIKSDPATASVPVLAYVSHVREDLIAGAREAGAEQVLARGAFARMLPSILTGQR